MGSPYSAHPAPVDQTEPHTTVPATPRAFTLIEILVSISLIVLLAGMLIPAVGLVRNRAKTTEAQQTLRELQTAFDLYRNEDPRRRFPTVAVDLSIGTDLMDRLEHHRMWARGFRGVDDQGRLLDPWQRWYRYSLTKPAPSTGSPALAAWNWDDVKARPRAWGSRVDPSNPGAYVEGPLPYAYLWSLGKAGTADDAGVWLLCEDDR
jgi:prepilin-type N-terminal cleavage/methylation domain-containing protein